VSIYSKKEFRHKNAGILFVASTLFPLPSGERGGGEGAIS